MLADSSLLRDLEQHASLHNKGTSVTLWWPRLSITCPPPGHQQRYRENFTPQMELYNEAMSASSYVCRVAFRRYCELFSIP